MYPLTLSQEEISCLRLMLRMTVVTRIHQAGVEFRESERLGFKGEADRDLGMDAFMDAIVTLTDTHRNIDTVLFFACLQGRDPQVVVLPEDHFQALKAISAFRYEGIEPEAQVIAANQPKLAAAFASAEKLMREAPPINIQIQSGEWKN